LVSLIEKFINQLKNKNKLELSGALDGVSQSIL